MHPRADHDPVAPALAGERTLPHTSVNIADMDTHAAEDDLPPLTPRGSVPHTVPIGSVIDRWPCPCCDRTIEMVHRPGRPRIYCSQACRQHAYRWRRTQRAHTVSSPSWPVESASVRGGKRSHALRTERDPLSRRRDRRAREVTVCGALAHPHQRGRVRGERVPFLGPGPDVCRTCTALVRARPLGLVPPGATPPRTPMTRDSFRDVVRALHAISDDYPLGDDLRRLLTGLWAA